MIAVRVVDPNLPSIGPEYTPSSLSWRCSFPRELGIGGNEIVRPRHLHAVAGIEEKTDIGALQSFAEAAHRLAHLILLEIGAFHHLDAEALQDGRYVGGVVARVARTGTYS